MQKVRVRPHPVFMRVSANLDISGDSKLAPMRCNHNRPVSNETIYRHCPYTRYFSTVVEVSLRNIELMSQLVLSMCGFENSKAPPNSIGN